MVSSNLEVKASSINFMDAFKKISDSMAYSGDLDYRDGKVFLDAIGATGYRIVASDREGEVEDELCLVDEIEDPLEAFYLLDLLRSELRS